MTTAIVNRISLWLIVAVLALIALATVLLTVLLYESGTFHVIGSALHHSPFFASQCGSTNGEC
jgi:hypothetical protein